MLDNLIGAEKSLLIATPFAIKMIKALRKVRRYIPFI
jgi:hypothetical protein